MFSRYSFGSSSNYPSLLAFNTLIGQHAGPSTLRSLQSFPTTRAFSSTTKRLARTHGNLSHYDALKLSKNSTKQQIKAKFYELSKQYHPDAKGGDTAKFHEINDAYAVLGDDTKRRQYDLSLSPASQSTHHTRHGQGHGYGYGSHGHSSFSPRDPYLHRAAQGPHRAWNNNSSTSTNSNHPRTENYNPFGRKTPPNFQYEYEYNFNYNPNSRTTNNTSSSATAKRKKQQEDEEALANSGGGIWKFLVTVSLIFVVISLGGGLTANSSTRYHWTLLESVDADLTKDKLGLNDKQSAQKKDKKRKRADSKDINTDILDKLK
ncbi:uncharacterized protein L201_000424 [Kwoniella dendrophila CBS 6074]|uniref:J domain-containing protein n=1 Tax=Kwoniella dendrophila CBS 6074 TaxID=1295534 RepID=A0AAX4JLY1_9TREE